MNINKGSKDDELELLEEENLVEESNKPIEKTIKEYAISIVICVVIALLLKTFVIARADVDGDSMYPTLHNNDVLFVNRLSKINKDYKRGDIIIFDSLDAKNDIYIKRIIAVAGDEVEIKDDKVYLNGEELQENYLAEGTITEPGIFMSDKEKFTVPEGYIFVMGDNRENSKDSRTFGSVSLEQVEGKVFVRLFPVKDFKTF
ncbi:Signal peptidase I S [Clostridium sp. N3C]|uniref:signal peptidase I n=1 Tax=Clostridium sp. N3C TaxID=1776758 RepID=UPI00092DEBBC|nr:signal peptidase I [Clostridium sp. N3C]SCN25305.1 Signal peptidase I S [Clostridium sp. N3C]